MGNKAKATGLVAVLASIGAAQAAAGWLVVLTVVGVIVGIAALGIAIWQQIPDPHARVVVQVAADGQKKPPLVDTARGDDRIAAKRDSIVGIRGSVAVADLTVVNPVVGRVEVDSDLSKAEKVIKGGSAFARLEGSANGKVEISRVIPPVGEPVDGLLQSQTALVFDYDFPRVNLGFEGDDCGPGELSLDLDYGATQDGSQAQTYQWGFTAKPNCETNMLEIVDRRGDFSDSHITIDGFKITHLDPPDVYFPVPYDTPIDVKGSLRLAGQVPEPGTAFLVGLGLSGLLLRRNRRRAPV